MKRKSSVVLLFVLLLAGDALAEDSVTVFGNYYKETSTRIYEPIFHVLKDLPDNYSLDGTFIVDQITSASGAFTPQDKVISELREEANVALRRKINDTFTPGILGRISYEPDYTSLRAGADLAISLDRDNTVFRLFAQYQSDDVRERMGMFNDYLHTTAFGASATQVLTRDWIAGASLEAQILRGYLENVYRPETHPRRRNRYSACAWTSYYLDLTKTAARVEYRFYTDTWELKSHAIGLELNQTVTGDFEVFGKFRYYTQGEAFFARSNLFQQFNTRDPKLMKFDSTMYSIGLRIPLSFLGDTSLDPLANSRIEPVYTYLNQHNQYGPAHIAQLGWYWPF